MKTLHRLYLSPRELTAKQKAERERAAEFLGIDNLLTIKNQYHVVPDLIKRLRVEPDKDLEEKSIKELLPAGVRVHTVHLVMTDVEWKRLGLRKDLYGQSKVVDGVIVTYGRWGYDKRKLLPKYAKNIQTYLTEATLGEWHELDHGLREIWKTATSTHYHFYGYAEQYKLTPKKTQDAIKPRRFVRKPDPLQAWDSLPWHKLADLNEDSDTKEVAEKKGIIARLRAKIAGMIAKRIKEEEIILARLQPSTSRKAKALIKAMMEKGHVIDITSGYRSPEEQTRLYAQGRTAPGKKVTNAKAGESLHNYGVAFDVAFMVDGKPSWDNKHPWQLLGETGEALGLSWGGRWTALVDRPHFEELKGYTLRDFMRGDVDYGRYA